MTAGEDQPQPIIDQRGVLVHVFLLAVVEAQQLRQALSARGHRTLTPQPIDRLAPCRRREPSPRTIRHPVALPGLNRRSKRILEGILGALEVTDMTDET